MNRPITLISISFLILLGGFASGCGGGSNDNDGSNSQSPPANRSGSDDETQVRTLAEKVAKYTTSSNYKRFCKLFIAEEMDAVVGKGQCEKVFKQAFKRKLQPSQFKIGEVEIDGERAKVAFEGEGDMPGYGHAAFTKVEGKWYVAVPESEGMADFEAGSGGQ